MVKSQNYVRTQVEIRNLRGAKARAGLVLPPPLVRSSYD